MILFIGDAMGNAYRGAGRIVSRSVPARDGRPGLREGLYDRWMEMDQMPVSGMVLNPQPGQPGDGLRRPGHGWSTGNKTDNGMLSALPDGTDCHRRQPGEDRACATSPTTHAVESILEYLKRRFDYRTGNVSTAFITDATPGRPEGSHVANRAATFEVARQYLENPMLGGKPAFDVLMGGGKEDFRSRHPLRQAQPGGDFQKQGFRFVCTATELKDVDAKTPEAPRPVPPAEQGGHSQYRG